MKITPSSAVRETVESYPSTGGIFLQHGSLARNVTGQLYATYDADLTVEEFARQNGIGVDGLIARLAAAVEAEEFERRQNPGGAEPANRYEAPPEMSLGYTGSRQQERAPGSLRSVVSVQNSRGPE